VLKNDLRRVGRKEKRNKEEKEFFRK